MTLEEELEQMQQDAFNDRDNGEEQSEKESNEEEEENDEETNDEGSKENIEEDEQEESENKEEEKTERTLEKKGNKEFEPINVLINGQKISLDTREEMIAFINKSANSIGRKQSKSENDQILEQGNITREDLQLLVDAKNGNKAAINKLAKTSGVDILDIDENEEYKPQFNPVIMTEIDEIANDILSNEDLAKQFKQTLKIIPDDFKKQISSDPNALKQFASHIESGLAAKIIPEAIKSGMMNDKSFIENYVTIGKRMYDEELATGNNNDKTSQRKTNPKAEELRKRASNPKGLNQERNKKDSADDIWNMSDEEFNKKFM